MRDSPLFNKPTKEKQAKAKVKLTESKQADTGLQRSGGKINSPDAGDSSQAQIVEPGPRGPMARLIKTSKSTGKRFNVVVEMPSVVALIAAFLVSSVLWLFTYGPAADSTITILQGARKFEAALIVLNSKLMFNPSDYHLIMLRAWNFQNQGNTVEALKDASTVASAQNAQNSDRANASALWGEILDETGKHDEALGHFKDAGKLDKESAMFFHRRGFYFLNYGKQPATALRLEGYALTINPDLAVAYVNHAKANLDLSQPQKAVDDCNKGLSLNINWAKQRPVIKALLHLNNSVGYYELGDFQKSAENGLKSAQEYAAIGNQNDDELSAWQTSAMALLELGKPHETLKACQSALLKFPRDGVLLDLQQKAYLALGNKEAAAASGPKSTEEKETAFDFYITKARNLLAAKNYSLTVLNDDRALPLAENPVWTYATRGEAHLRLNHNTQAVDDLTSALGQDTDTAGITGTVHYLRSLAYSNLNQLDKASQDMEIAKKKGFQKFLPGYY